MIRLSPALCLLCHRPLVAPQALRRPPPSIRLSIASLDEGIKKNQLCLLQALTTASLLITSMRLAFATSTFFLLLVTLRVFCLDRKCLLQ